MHYNSVHLTFVSLEVGPTPTVTITPVNSTVTLTGDYTIAMVDAGPVGSDISEGVTRHWLLNKVTIAGMSNQVQRGYTG